MKKKTLMLSALALSLSMALAPVTVSAAQTASSDSLQQPSLAPMLEKVMPSVVSISVEGTTTAKLVELTGMGRSSIYRWLQELVEEGDAHISHTIESTCAGQPAAVYVVGPAPEGHVAPIVRSPHRNKRRPQTQSSIQPRPAEDYLTRMRRHAVKPGRHYLTAALFGAST